ncbi:uncharacterized protein LOC135366044 [Ornithodoros turicata]|uniref:uncharacterized protein LOC135366044 n=1 Tax=Ornithodoros turicata TaxID=34597 RepID=UPI00313A1091
MSPHRYFIAICGILLLERSVFTSGNTVYLTVSSLAKPAPRRLEINWYNVPRDIVHNVEAKLYRRNDPLSQWALLQPYPVDAPNGTVQTNWTFPLIQFSPGTINASRECLIYKVTLVRHSLTRGVQGEHELASSCIRGRPTWVRDSCSALSGFMLHELMLPGTHNSGMYDRTSPGTPVPFQDFIYNQEEDVFSQLVYGIRFLDLRVRQYRSDYWITHDNIRGQITVREMLESVRAFVKATGEVVVVDFHRFTNGFERSDPDHDRNHEALINLILDKLEDVMMYKHAVATTLGELLNNCSGSNATRTVLVSYNSNFIRGKTPYLVPGSRHLWADARDVDSLKDYLKERICLYTRGVLTSAMAELTAKFPFFLVGNRKLAQRVNGNVTQWFRDEWWRCANVVSTDFFLGNDIVNVAVEANLRRAREAQRST